MDKVVTLHVFGWTRIFRTLNRVRFFVGNLSDLTVLDLSTSVNGVLVVWFFCERRKTEFDYSFVLLCLVLLKEFVRRIFLFCFKQVRLKLTKIC